VKSPNSTDQLRRFLSDIFHIKNPNNWSRKRKEKTSGLLS